LFPDDRVRSHKPGIRQRRFDLLKLLGGNLIHVAGSIFQANGLLIKMKIGHGLDKRVQKMKRQTPKA
jgi:hypothetical protein